MANEVRLIDANALEKDMRAYADNKAYCGHIELANGIIKGVGRIDLAPTIDPESLRPKGRWGIYRESEISKTVYCTNCWKEFYIHRKGEVQIDTQPYCPNCGAKMEGEG